MSDQVKIPWDRWFSLDIETTAIKPKLGQVLEFAGVLEDWKSPIEELPYFHTYILHKEIHGDPVAIAMNADIIAKIAKPGNFPGETFTPPGDLLLTINRWLAQHGIDPYHVTVGGKNVAGFDIPWITQPEYHVGSSNPEDVFKSRHRVVDPGILYWNPEIDGNVLPDTKTCYERAGMDPTVKHRAYKDACSVIELVRHRRDKLTG